ncbi:MAG: VWA domain-containing protein [Acidobacteriota bacterium]|nr:VWA domain-containing protein [Acidobacteriota bacterium]
MNCPKAFRQPAFAIYLFVILAASGFAALAQTPNQQSQDPQQPAIEKIPTTLVNVPVIVTDRFGRFITGLNRNNFSIREDGVTQKVEDFSSTETPFNVALLIDTSRSTQNKLSAIRKAALTFIKQLKPDDRVMIVTFDEQVRFASGFTNNRAELERSIKAVKTSYQTSLYDAIHLTINEKMIPIKGRKAIVILTDGVDTSSKRATFESSLELVAATGIISYAIQYETRNDGGPIMKPIFLPGGPPGASGANFSGASTTWQEVNKQSQQTKPETQTQEKDKQDKPFINIPRPTGSVFGEFPSTVPKTSAPNSTPSTRINSQIQQPIRDRYLIAADFMRSLAAQSGALYIRAESIENTTFAFQRIAEELRHQYALTYVSTNEQKDGNYRSIAVRINSNDLVVRARLGYRVPKIEEAAGAEKKAKP